MTLMKPCPNGCSSAGEVWTGEGLEVCPVCHGNTVVPTPTPAAPQDAPETIWIKPNGLYASGKWLHAGEWVDHSVLGYSNAYTRKDLSDARIAELEAQNANMQILLDWQMTTSSEQLATARNEVLEEVMAKLGGRTISGEHQHMGIIRALKTPEGE